MKKISLLLMLILGMNSCKKIDKLTQFNLHFDTEATIPAGLPINTPFNIPSIEIPLQTKSVFENNNTAKELVEQAILKELKLTLIDPADGNFNFLKDMEIYISSDELPEIKIAWIYNHPNDNKNTLLLDTTPMDLQEYVKSDKLNIRIKTTFDEILTRDYHLKIDFTFFIDAKILGI